ncbi:MAG: HAMP domain-containing sensor histidine kinase [Pseudomonadota bacterium]
MYSILPAFVALLFLGYGAYVLGSRGANRTALTFFFLCFTTFALQFTWAVLFQVRDEELAVMLARGGYFLILFLPTTLYHFIAELTRQRSEARAVRMSYAISAVMGASLFFSDAIVAGAYHTFFGYYPKAGPLHPLHVLQTSIVVCRAAWLLLRQLKVAVSTERLRLRYCLASLLIYFLAAIDYMCNYGLEIYPPGVIFIAISLGIIAQAMARHNLLANPMVLAATVAHELRTPLATIRNQARFIKRAMPQLIAAYENSQLQDGAQGTLPPAHLDYLRELGSDMESEVSRSNFIADMVLASANPALLGTHDFESHSIEKCVAQALASYPFDSATRAKVVLQETEDFHFHGSDTLLIYVLYNLIKNALAAVDGLAHGKIEIAFYRDQGSNKLIISDTGHGIPEHVLPHVFDPFYTTKNTKGTGMGLAFCRRVITSFGGKIRCRSREGAFTMMAMEFPVT